MAYQNNPNTENSRNRNYILPLAILAIAVLLGFMFLMPDDDANNMADTAPAAGAPADNASTAPNNMTQ